VDDNVWEYPFGELDDDEDMFFHEPENGREKLELIIHWQGISLA
jgi:hypothetical protein